ncbi:7537_t:CDS:1, partial [Rhizophagus irregularis]
RTATPDMFDFNIRIFHEAINRLLGRSRDKRYKKGIINFVKDIKEFVK